jgi:multicomponent Na+:H+ antiporter subunit C
VSALLALTIALIAAAGVYLALSRDLFRCIVGLAVLGSAANLIVFAAGRFESLQPPILAAGATELAATAAANPLPQALVLTAIVISFALLCFALVLGARLRQQGASDDTDQWRDAEPPATDPVKPAVLE